MDIENLEQHIVVLEQKLAGIKDKLKGNNNEDIREEWLNLSKEQALAIRDLTLNKGEEQVIKYYPDVIIGIENKDISPKGLIWLPSPSSDAPTLFQDQTNNFLIFDICYLQDDGFYESYLNKDSSLERLRAIVEVKGCVRSKFGFPGREEINGHPLSDKGLGGYSIFEVINSSWNNRYQTMMNASWISKLYKQRNPDPTADYVSNKCHFIILFRECSFECLADDLKIILSEDSDEKIRELIAKKIAYIKTPKPSHRRRQR